MSEARYMVGDVFDRMATIPHNSIDLIVTSPPFLALRSYLPADHPDKHKEIGSEATPAAFLSTMLALTREWRRILAPHGSLCVELGDTYSGSGGGGGDYLEGGLREGQPGFGGSADRQREGNAAHWRAKNAQKDAWPLAKSLCLLPTLYPASLAYGRNLLNPDDTIDPWRVRNLIVWHRPNPPVGALGDKVRPSTSYVTTACVSGSRWFDLDAERGPIADSTAERHRYSNLDMRTKDKRDGGGSSHGMMADNVASNPAGAPPLDMWNIPTAPYSGSHYATFPPALPRKLINLMCPRQVCVVCGEPRRRRLNDKAAFEFQPQLAAHIKERREALGITSAEINERLGYKEIAKNWERTDRHGAAIPNANDWAVIKPWLGLSDEYDALVCGDRRWTESTVEYHANGEPLGNERRNGDSYGRGGHDSPNQLHAHRVAPTDWSDCGHNTWRRGVVLDPFAGSGTTLMAASELGRDSIGIDLDPRNLHLAQQRCGMFLTEAP